jgi:hypothetical protein
MEPIMPRWARTAPQAAEVDRIFDNRRNPLLPRGLWP